MVVVANSLIVGRTDADGVRLGRQIPDWEAFTGYLPNSASDADVGVVVRRALRDSRIEMPRDWAAARDASHDYDQALAEAFALRSRANLYVGMTDVSAWWSQGEVTFSPSQRRLGGVFEGFPVGKDKGREDIVIPFDSSDEALGAAIKECLSRCL